MLLGLFGSTQVFAADSAVPPTLAEDNNTATAHPPASVVIPPDLPRDSDSRDPIKPEVTIIHKQDTTIEEYRVGGRLRYAKITPKVGKPYYMVDTDGDGILETRHNDLSNPPVNQWILMEW